MPRCHSRLLQLGPSRPFASCRGPGHASTLVTGHVTRPPVPVVARVPGAQGPFPTLCSRGEGHRGAGEGGEQLGAPGHHPIQSTAGSWPVAPLSSWMQLCLKPWDLVTLMICFWNCDSCRHHSPNYLDGDFGHPNRVSWSPGLDPRRGWKSAPSVPREQDRQTALIPQSRRGLSIMGLALPGEPLPSTVPSG